MQQLLQSRKPSSGHKFWQQIYDAFGTIGMMIDDDSFRTDEKVLIIQEWESRGFN